MKYKMLDKIINALAAGKKLILLPGNADADAVGSAVALSVCFSDTTIIAPDGLNRTGKKLCSKLKMNILPQVDEADFDTIVVVDTARPEQLGSSYNELLEKADKLVVIDHHGRCRDWPTNLYYCDESKRSCAEIVYQILKKKNCRINRKIGLALLVGISADTSNLRHANIDSVNAYTEIMKKSKIKTEQIYSIFSNEIDVSQRIAQLKGAQRLKIDKIKDYVIAGTRASSFESSLCKTLIFLGADIAFAGSQRGDEYRISARARPDVVKKGFHLAHLLNAVSEETEGASGGHDGAAGIKGTGDVEAILSICMQKSKEVLEKIVY